MFKQFLRKILPPPAESISRHVDKLMDAFEDQQNLTYMLMQQTEALSRKISALQGEELPPMPVSQKSPWHGCSSVFPWPTTATSTARAAPISLPCPLLSSPTLRKWNGTLPV